MRKKIIALVVILATIGIIANFAVFFIAVSFIQDVIIRPNSFPYDAMDAMLPRNGSILSHFSLNKLLYRSNTVEISFDYATPISWTEPSSFSYSLNQTAPTKLSSTSWSDAKYHVYHVSGTLRNLSNDNYRLEVYVDYVNGTSKKITARSFTVDTNFVEPTLKVISPVNQTTYNTDEIELSYTTNSEVIMSYYSLDKGIETGPSTNSWNHFKGNITLTNLSEGSHTLVLLVQTENYFLSGSTPFHTINFNVDTTKHP